MLKKKIQELDLRLTEISKFLDISRPTLYKFIDNYDNGITKGIPIEIKKLFKFILNSNKINKIDVISYLFNNIINVDLEIKNRNNINSLNKNLCNIYKFILLCDEIYEKGNQDEIVEIENKIKKIEEII